jgi:hypothetical protein
MAGYYLGRLRGVLGLPVRALFPWRLLGANLAISALAGIPVALLILAGLGGFLQLVVAAPVYGLCYLGLMVVARRFDAQEIEWGRRAIGTVLRRSQRRFSARPTDTSA